MNRFILILLVLVYSCTPDQVGKDAAEEVTDAANVIANQMDLSTDKFVRVIDDGIRSMDNNSKDWQEVIEDVKNEIPKQFQSILSTEVDNLVRLATGLLSTEVRCNIEFVDDRVRWRCCMNRPDTFFLSGLN